MSSYNYPVGDVQLQADSEVTEVVTTTSPTTAPVQNDPPKKRLPNRLAELKDADQRFILNGAPWFKAKKGAKGTKSRLKKAKLPHKNRSIHSRPQVYSSQPPARSSEQIRSMHELESQTSLLFEQKAEYHANPFQRSQSEMSWVTVNEIQNSSNMPMMSNSPICSDNWSHIEAYMAPPSHLSALPRVGGPSREPGHSVAPPMVPEAHSRSRGLVSLSTVAPSTFIAPAPQAMLSHEAQLEDGSAMPTFYFQEYSSSTLGNPAPGTGEYFNEREVEIINLPYQAQSNPELLDYYVDVSDPRGNAEYPQQYAAHQHTGSPWSSF